MTDPARVRHLHQVILSHVLRFIAVVAAVVGALLFVMWVLDSGSPTNSGELLVIASFAFSLAAACVRGEMWIVKRGLESAVAAAPADER